MDANEQWHKVLDVLKNQLSSHNFRTWFSTTQMDRVEESRIVLRVPSAFIKGQQIARYGTMLSSALQEVLGKDLQIEYIIDPNAQHKKEINIDEDLFSISSQPTQNQTQTLLNSKYTLKNFVVGPTNNLAFAAAQAVVQNPGISYNPLFIYGPSGVGKTHLMQAIGNAVVAKNPYTKLVFVSSERFMVDFVESIQGKSTGSFRQKYRYCDVLLIDDIQFIAGKDSTQEEFFHTFNELHSKNAQIVLTSDRPPNELQRLEDRLRSRFQGGLMVDIQLPDYETRIAILKAKLLEKGETLPEESINTIAGALQSNTRELEGKLIQILQMSKLSGQEPTPEFVQKHMGTFQASVNKTVDHKKVLSRVNEYFNIKMQDITGPRRQKELVVPRQFAMYLLYEDCKLPMEKIGQILGGRDHTTILHGIEKIRTSLVNDREAQRLLSEIRQDL